MWIDAHCHLAHPRAGDLDQVIARSKAAGVGAWVQGGISPEDWGKQVQIAQKFGKNIIKSFGLHPWWVMRATPPQLDQALETLTTLSFQCDAIGELGLDYADKTLDDSRRSIQQNVFAAQVQIAKDEEKPMILHVVRAHPEALKILRKSAPYPAKGIVHSFSTSFETAKEYLKLGFLLSVGGAVTWDGFSDLKNAIPRIPPESLVVETDSPDQTPRIPGVSPSESNEPKNLVGIAEAIGKLRGETAEVVLNRSNENLKRIFKGVL